MHVTVVVRTRNTDPDAGLQLTFGAESTRSVAVAVKVTFAPLFRDVCTEMSEGTVSAGGVVSRTSTSKFAWPVLPCLSVAEQETLVCPSVNVDPDAGVQVTGIEPPPESVAVTV